MSINKEHSFWGSLSPLGGLTGAGLLVMSTARLSWAITVAGSLFWVYGLSTLAYVSLCNITKIKIMPKKGNEYIYICLSSFFGSIYIFMFWLLCPFAIMEVFVQLLLVPLYCAASVVSDNIFASAGSSKFDIFEYVSDALSQAGVLAVLLIAFAVLREPFAFCSLSFPGSAQGMMTIMYFKAGAFFPIGIFASSAGGLLMLGFFVCLYQYCRNVLYRGV